MLKFGKIFQVPYILWWLPITAILVFFYPVLFGDKLISGVAHGLGEDLPMHFWFSHALKEGTWRINHLYFGGVASYLSQMDFFHPITFLFYKFLTLFKAYYGMIALSFIGQWYGFYLLARKLKISVLSSVFGSFVWIFNQWNIQWGGLEAIGLFLVWVPLLFYLALKINERKHKIWYALSAILILAPNWVFALTQTTLYLAAALGVFALYLDFQSVGWALKRYRNTFIWILIFILSIILISPVIQAIYSIHELGWRSGGLSYAESFNDYYNIFDLIHFVSPFIVLPFINTEYTHFYFGILPLLLVFLTWKIKDKSLYVRFFQWMAILTMLFAVKYSPLFYILNQLPIFNFFRGSAKFLFLTSLSVALLSGYGLDALKEKLHHQSFVKIFGFYKKFLIIFGSVIVAVNLLYYFAFDKYRV